MRISKGFLLGLAAGLAACGLVRADVIIFKDGFVLTGKIKQGSEIYVDPISHQPLMISKGPFFLDGDARVFSFSFNQIGDVDHNDPVAEADLVKLEYHIPRIFSDIIPPIADVSDTGPFNDKWERWLKLETTGGNYRVEQRVGVLTPQFFRADALRYNWSAGYLTSELSPEVVKGLLSQHLDLRLKGDKNDAGRRFRIFRFLAQAGLFDEAGQQLDAILRDLPDEKDKVEADRDQLRKLRLLQRYEDIERGFKAGQHRWVQRALADFPDQGVDDKVLAGIRAYKAKYETADDNLKTAQRFLKDLPSQAPAAQRELFTEAAGIIQDELRIDDFLLDPNEDKDRRATQAKVQRLESFLAMALQAERDRNQGRPTAEGPSQLLARAVTGWLQGKDAADPKIEAAQRLWRARQFVREYEQTPRPDIRQKLLHTYEMQKTQALAPDEMARLIALLPPPESSDKDLGPDPVELQVDLPDGRSRGASYVVQLPPEYHPGRAYPVLLALHQGAETPSAIVERFGRQTARHGYILAAPEWTVGIGSPNYNYTAEEQTAILDVLRDVRRRFQVDSDRVFLTGFGEGGNAAYDVGLAHPDLFAGVLPIAGQPQWYAVSCWHNAQNLPFFVVNGDHAGDLSKHNRQQFEKWIPRGYPALHVEYKGRGQEWFGGDLPTMFSWMEHKVRSHAVPELGKDAGGGPLGDEYQTLRETDNRFYWLSSDAVADAFVMDPSNWGKRAMPATLTARIFGESNQINVTVHGLKQLTVWLTPDGTGLDLSKPVTIRVNGTALWNKRLAPPSLSTLLEDFYQRRDRQSLFLARVDFDRF